MKNEEARGDTAPAKKGSGCHKKDAQLKEAKEEKTERARSSSALTNQKRTRMPVHQHHY